MWLSKKILMHFKMQQMPKELSERLFFSKNLTAMKTLSVFKMLLEQRMIVIFIWFLILWILIYMLLSGQIFLKIFINSTLFISVSNVWNICILPIFYIEICNQVIFYLILNAIWKLQTLVWIDHLIHVILINNLY